MTALLVIVGVAVGFALGVWVMRRGRADATPEPAVPRGADPVNEHALVEEHRDGVVVTDRSGVVTYRNRAARDLQGTHVGVLVDEAIDRHVGSALELGHSTEVLELYGPPKMVLVVEAQALDEGGAVVFVEDVTERRRIEEVRTDFVANISHELKTPVGAMSVLAETLEDETDPATIHRVVARMMSEAQRATRTIDDLMELSRIEAGDEHKFEPIDVEMVVAGAVERVTELASHREIGLTNLTPAGRLDGVMIVGDRRQLVSALGNLVENAVKYSEPGGQVQLRTHVGGSGVQFSVIDQGAGIPQHDLDRIFERFYRVDRARSRSTGGTGLGLSIVRHVANNHGGTISVDSTEGEGSVFTLVLPAQVPGITDADADETGDQQPEHSDRGIA